MNLATTHTPQATKEEEAHTAQVGAAARARLQCVTLQRLMLQETPNRAAPRRPSLRAPHMQGASNGQRSPRTRTPEGVGARGDVLGARLTVFGAEARERARVSASGARRGGRARMSASVRVCARTAAETGDLARSLVHPRHARVHGARHVEQAQQHLHRDRGEPERGSTRPHASGAG